MPADISIFFKNPAQGLKKALAGFQQAQSFQDGQRAHLLAHLSSNVSLLYQSTFYGSLSSVMKILTLLCLFRFSDRLLPQARRE